MAEVRIYGIRHHGPGSSRSLLLALEEFRPGAVLIEAPADAEACLQLIANEGLVPPVALLVYPVDDSARSVFYPATEFSPEWNASKFALRTGAALRAIDLPVSAASPKPTTDQLDSDGEDPFAMIAEVSGYPDGEAFWENLVEQRHDPKDLFQAVTELMTSLRESAGESKDPREAQREAHMRLAIKRAESEGFERIAVVCGAWHVPALLRKVSQSADQAVLKGLPKIKTAATWVPYTHERVAAASGYRAGVRSPGYYQHLWQTPPAEVSQSWLLKTAYLLRREGFDASTASVIEASRLVDALCAMRDRTSPGLREFTDATLAILTQGHEAPLLTIQRQLIVGDCLGEVPANIPTVPLQSDLAACQKRLRLKPEALERRLELDLRNETDLSRSQLLHRLTILSVPWGQLQRVGGKQGTFHEHWLLRWQPELSICVIDASIWGGTVESAAAAKALHSSREIESLPALTRLAHDVLLAALDSTIPEIMRRLEDAAAVATDTKDLLEALPSLGRVMRYGDVRKTSVDAVGHVFSSIFVRACVGLPAATAMLDGEAAVQMVGALDGAQSVVALVSDPEQQELWTGALQTVVSRGDVHPLVSGRACRILFDAGAMSADEASTELSRASSVGATPSATAGWIEGFLGSSGAVLLHHDKLWKIVDDWVCGLTEEAFIEVLPLLRRSFAGFAKGERRQLGEKTRGDGGARKTETVQIDEDRANRPLPLLRRMLGIEEPA